MRTRHHHRYKGLILIAFLWMGVTGATACQIPVFRFALERWAADAYTVVIVQASSTKPLTDAEQAVVDFLQTAKDDNNISANLEVRVDRSTASESGGAEMALYYPQKISGLEVSPIWSGPLTMQNAHLVVDSPARREIVKRLLAGESSTWLLVRSGDTEKDETAIGALTEFVAAGKETLRIPEGVVQRSAIEGQEGSFAGDPDNILRSDIPLQIDFSFVEIDRKDPAEEVFLKMLLNVEDDLGEFASDPMVFPVFGRARVLEPLVGAGVTRDNALDYAGYLCGACSCEVKDQNPGLDLLVAANWEAAIEGNEVVIDKVLPPLAGIAGLGDASPDLAAESKIEQENVGSSFSLPRVIGITLVAAALAVVLGSFFMVRRGRR